ncbi:NAD-dependent aldehyde dehydrogenase, CoA-acylating [Syntrophotalea carbinolica DSM 2380]|uniref:NAD-dependent aldehyde dehydrogenase, CoA-acylating n=1 Tax=Syntrophotalea carbinolica (strain DSM 2380 / NBRC 103641 / GraBd1) TaxID=338963 RepID=Q3A0W4_SYNC1|nr:aldehyde dehydrogenase family protein [Syntrophotalea carbinolica]ABA89993.1 NAD-dependent aldehyde dehydrogenase, CoA-acylating [Syntrophotalea carbinolica DSM 2380]
MAKEMIDQLVANARKAADEFREFTQEQVDKITAAMDAASVANEVKLGELAVEETGIGRADHKAIKNHLGAHVVYEYFKDKKSVGVIEEKEGVKYIAEPFGVLAAATPTTNPTSTVMFKSLIAMKTRNVIIFAFHPRAQKCSAEAAKIMLDAAISAGAPKNCIQWIETPSIEATNMLFNHPDVNLILATGGNAMVKSAYSSGHPAIGVGAGNTPVFVSKSANLSVAVNNVIASKTFDNGTICSSDQSMIFDDKDIADKAVKMLVERGAYLVNDEEKAKLEKVMFDKERGVPAVAIVGKSPQAIAKLAGFEVPEDAKLLLVPLKCIGPDDWFSHEKLSPVLGYISYNSTDEAIEAAKSQLRWGGAGHTAVVHAQDEKVLDKFALEIPANRLLLNQPAVHGSVGLIYNKLPPSLTLGCGTDGNNYLGNNINYSDLLSIKSVAQRIVDYERDE